MRTLLAEAEVRVVAEVDRPAGVYDAVRDPAARIVLAAPADGGHEDLFRQLGSLPRSALVLLPVQGFRIRSEALRKRFSLPSLPLTVDRHELRASIEETLRAGEPQMSLERVCAGVGGTLTAREQEVLRELAEGSSNREIARRLWLSQDTVKSHLRRIFRKLDVGSRTEAVALYLGELRAAR
jgi:DNA-binding NarL/FixJ family response regulator